jgi:glycerol-1-phosphate dehydrogenase [NAD(P)+]
VGVTVYQLCGNIVGNVVYVKSALLMLYIGMKYDLQKHAQRLPRILENWDSILQILREELPDRDTFQNLMNILGIPACLNEDSQTARIAFRATKDIRDKYVLSRLVWDLGIMDEICAELA